jgi:hypothetical protein
MQRVNPPAPSKANDPLPYNKIHTIFFKKVQYFLLAASIFFTKTACGK